MKIWINNSIVTIMIESTYLNGNVRTADDLTTTTADDLARFALLIVLAQTNPFAEQLLVRHYDDRNSTFDAY